MGVVNLADLARVLRTTTKKGHQLFQEKKCTPPEKILATPMPDRPADHK